MLMRTAGPEANASGARLTFVAYLVTILAALPLLAAAPLPLQDWPGHLARVHILDEMLRGVGPWRAYYELNSFLLPNVVLDLGVLGLLRLGLSLDAAGAVFLLLTYLVFVSGFVRLSASFGAGDAVRPLLGATLFYNLALVWGFLNFLFGLGAMLWVAGLWLAAGRTRTRLAIAALGSAATFFCHLIPAVLLVGMLGVFDLLALWRAGRPAGRTLLRHCTSLAAAAVVLALFKLSPSGADQLSAVKYVADNSVADTLRWKATLFPKVFLQGGIRANWAFAVFGVLLAVTMLWAARIRMALAPLLIVAAITLLALVAPESIGQGGLFDVRLAVVPLIVAAAAVELRWRRASGPLLVVAAAAVLVLARSAVYAKTWHDAGRIYATIEAALAEQPPGGALLVAQGRFNHQIQPTEFWAPPMNHVSVLALRHGHFVPSVFAFPTQQPLVLDQRFRGFVLPLRVSTPEELESGLTAARALCPGGGAETTFPSVWIAVLYPQPSMQPPRFKAVTSNYFLTDACAPP